MEQITQEQVKSAIDHMNTDHMDANLIYIRAWGDVKNPTEAKMKTLTNDHMTFDVVDSDGKSHNDIKITFPKPLQSAEDAHMTLVKMVGQGRKILGASSYAEKDMVKMASELVKNSKILHLSTTDKNGQPEVGYTQFAGNENYVYIMISEMTAHCKDILAGNNKISVMFNQNERDSKELAALERFIAQGVAIEIEYDTDEWKQAHEKLVARCGKIYNNLAKMADFHMFKVELNNARYVKGFGLIFDRIDGKWDVANSGGGHKFRK